MITVETLRGELKLQPNVARDARLAMLIEGVTETIGHELNRYLGTPAATAEILDVRPMLLLADDPLASPAPKVEERRRPGAAWEDASADWEVEGRAVRAHHHRRLRMQVPELGKACLRVTYTRGYAVGAGPAELRLLVLDLAAAKFLTAGRQGLQSEDIGDYSYTVADLSAVDAWPQVCRRWRREPV